MPRRILRALLAHAVAVAGATTISHSSLQAQGEEWTPPTISISPSTFTTSFSSLSPSVSFSDQSALVAESRQILFNATDVTASFSWEPSGSTLAYANGSVSLNVGSNTLYASICDEWNNCNSNSVTYTYDPATYSVTVTPDNGGAFPKASTTRDQHFTVKNTSTASATFTLTAVCTGTAISGTCTRSPPSLTLNAGQSGTVTVTYTTTATVGNTGLLKLRAERNTTPVAKDSGTVNVTIGSPQKSAVTVAAANPGTTVERDLCLTIATGADAAYECGDLRLGHALPTTRTMNAARAPTLIYSSAHAHPFPLVQANVALPTGAAWPDSAVGILSVNDVEKARTRFGGDRWIPGRASRIALGYDALNDATGLYPYKVKVVTWYGATRLANSATGEMVIVNRKASPFGAGWWVAGVEQLNPATMVWIGGDGSVRKYLPTGTANVWAAVTIDRPDTLKYVTNWAVRDPSSGATSTVSAYVRSLPHGVKVAFDASGRHFETRTRLGHTTRFSYDASNRLSRIRLPIANDAAGPTYDFAYTTGAIQTVTSVVSGATNRVVTVASTSGRITSVTDPDNTIVGFTYDGTTNRINARTDRRGKKRHFAYDAAKKLASDSLPLSAPATTIRTLFRALESAGLTVALDTGIATTRVDGPRTDVGDTTHFWLDRFGAPRKVVNALGDSTLLTRANATFPALVTELRAPNGFVTRAHYDARGNLDTLKALNPYGTGQDALTTYRWDARWDFVTKIDPPLRDSLTFAYDTVTGNRLWQQDARGSTSRVEFRYDPTCLLPRASDPPLSAPDSVVYDAKCNVRDVFSPLGVRTQVVADALGRDTLIVTKIGQAASETLTQRLKFDRMDRDTAVITMGASLTDSITTPAETLFVSKLYDAEGNLPSLKRWTKPDSNAIGNVITQWAYDSANRVIWEQAPDAQRDSMRYDAASNRVAWRTRRGKEITMSYDALNRLLRRVVPGVLYADTMPCGSLPCAVTFPGRNIPKDSAEFGYDAAGNVIKANNYAARITRGYTPAGALAADTIRIGTWLNAADSTTHRYGLRYGYDLNGRRRWMKHPGTIAPRVAGVLKDSVAYDYWAHGPLKTVRDVLGNVFTYVYDLEGRVDSVAKPGSVGEKMRYDTGGRLIRRLLRAPLYGTVFSSDTVFKDTLTYDTRDKIRIVVARVPGEGSSDFFRYWYSGLGTVVRAHVANGSTEAWRTDALGNYRYKLDQTATQGTHQHVYAYQPGVGRLRRSDAPSAAVNFPDSTRYVYDAAGNTTFTRALRLIASQYHEDDVRNYYTANERLHAADRYVAPTSMAPTRAIEEYRYDALGRRVLVQQDNAAPGLEHIYPDFLERTVWDGDQVLYEIRYPHPQEHDTTTVASSKPMFGRVAYLHGLGIDQPLGLVRVGYQGLAEPFAFVPHLNWRGVIAQGTFADGKAAKCAAGGTPCVQVIFPAAVSGTYFEESQVTQPPSWMGNLIPKMRSGLGQLYNRNRYYDPKSGRFTQEDPIGLAGGLNLYGYANGDPVNLSDPFGLCPVCIIGAAWALYEVGSAAYDVYQAYKTVRDPNASDLKKGAMVAAATASVFGPGGGGTLVIGKMDDLARGVAAGERTLLPRMADDLGSPKANWARNAGLLREEMAKGKPIRDASVNAKGELTNNTGFLRAERELLKDHGWTYDQTTRHWNPPTK